MLVRPWAVFQRGRDYNRVDELFRAARYDEATDPRVAGSFWIWEDDGTNKLVVQFVKPGEERVEFAEVGSDLVPEE